MHIIAEPLLGRVRDQLVHSRRIVDGKLSHYAYVRHWKEKFCCTIFAYWISPIGDRT